MYAPHRNPLEPARNSHGAQSDGPRFSLTHRLTDAAVAIRSESSPRVDFLHSLLCQIGMPRRSTEARTFERRNGHASILIEAGKLWDGSDWVEQPLPSGAIPRLVMVHVSSEAVRTRSRSVEVGHSTRQFLTTLGMQTNGGKRGGYQALKRQIQALAACRLSLGMQSEGRVMTVDAKPIRRFEAWLHQDGDQGTLWPGVLELSDEFYGTLVEHAVPLDPRALAALRHSALALDVYAWLAHRLRRVARAGGIKLSWRNLYEQFGQEYRSTKDFKKQFRQSLRQALVVYPDARVAEVIGGITLYRSRAPMQPTKLHFSL